MILFVAGLLLRSFDRLLQCRPRVRRRTASRYCRSKRAITSSRQQAREVGRQLLERVQSLPGVESASLSGWALFRGWSCGQPRRRARARPVLKRSGSQVSPQFFRTMGTRLLDGREFQPGDSDGVDSHAGDRQRYLRAQVSCRRAGGRPAADHHAPRPDRVVRNRRRGGRCARRLGPRRR